MNDIAEIRHRIQAVSQTRQITRAMHLIASSKLKSAMSQHEANLAYHQQVGGVMANILAMTAGTITNPFFQRHRGDRAACIVIAGDKGLAGGYNHNVLQLAIEHMRAREQKVVYSIGHMAHDELTRAGFKVDLTYQHIIDSPQLYNARDMAGEIIDLFEGGELDEVWVIYTEMISSLQMKPCVRRLVPIRMKDLPEPSIQASPGSVFFQPSPEDVLRELVPQYVVGEIFSALIQSHACEQSARMQAMDAATRNANEMIDKLTLNFNRARQAAITQEITEIVK